MGNKVKGEQAKLPGGGDAGQNNQRGGCRARNRWNNAAAGGGAPGNNNGNKYTTRNKELPKNLVLDDMGLNNAANF
jgi:hypothetical protein